MPSTVNRVVDFVTRRLLRLTTELLRYVLQSWAERLFFIAEISPNNRAGCRNKECKDKGVKIFKGQLRLGTFVTTQDFQSFQYKHW